MGSRKSYESAGIKSIMQTINCPLRLEISMAPFVAENLHCFPNPTV